MDRKKQIGLIGGTIGLVSIVLVLTIVWAAFSTNLTISGSATVAKQSWGVEFQSLQNVQLGNDNGVTTGASEGTPKPTINPSTTIGNYSITLSKPGDYAIYQFNIVNTGTFNAIIDSAFTLPTPGCTPTGNASQSEANTVCNNIEYTFNYVNSGTVGDAVTSGDTISAGQTKTVQLKIYYKKTATQAQLPSDNITVGNLGFTMTFNQA